MSDDFFERKEPVRTDIHCHDCTKTFVARIDFSLDGNHVIQCPFCGHEHCRGIKDGKVTDERWNTRYKERIDVPSHQVWKHSHHPIQTSSASHFIRDKWLNRGDV